VAARRAGAERGAPGRRALDARLLLRPGGRGGKRVSATPVFGLPFLGGSEDGASIFKEPVATEGRRLPARAADPVHGRKIQVVPSEPLGVHEKEPEVQVLRIGDRLLLAAPGEPSVEMGRRFEAAVRPHLPAGVRDVVVVGLANDYLGYFTTPEEYEVQHYEGGHTVFGKWTSLLARDAFDRLTRALASGGPAPKPSTPGGLGSTDKGTPDVGAGTTPGRLLEAPSGTIERMSVVDVRWAGSPKGVDRPLDAPFLTVERRQGADFVAADSDLGLGVLWREADGEYARRYDVPPALPTAPTACASARGLRPALGAVHDRAVRRPAPARRDRDRRARQARPGQGQAAQGPQGAPALPPPADPHPRRCCSRRTRRPTRSARSPGASARPPAGRPSCASPAGRPWRSGTPRRAAGSPSCAGASAPARR
jgi:hypothetical protein